MTTYLPVFVSPQGEAETMSAYQSVLNCWPVPYTDLAIPASLGVTHVIASGPEGAPAVVLLHAFFASAVAWYPTAGTLSRQYRVYAVDIVAAGESKYVESVRAWARSVYEAILESKNF